jgi:hypothetical protein
MRIRLLFFLIILLLQMPVRLLANLPPAPATFHHQQHFKFTPAPHHGSNQVVNELLQIIADGSGKLRAFITYDVSAQLEVVCEPRPGNNYSLMLVMNNLNIKGDTHYRGFELPEIFYPQIVDFVVVFRNPTGQIVKEVKVENFHWQQSGKIAQVFQLPNNRTSLTMEISKVGFHYDAELQLKKISRLREALGTYYQAGKKIDTAIDMMSGLNASKFENAVLEEFRLCDAEVQLSQLKNESFLQILPLHKNDPDSILTSLVALDKKISSLRSDFNYVISNLDDLFYAEGLRNLVINHGKARDCFERAVSYNPLHIPSHIELSKSDLRANRHKDAMVRFSKLLKDIHPPGIWKNETNAFIRELYSRAVARAQEAMSDGRYLDALKILDEVEKFCNSIYMWECPADLFVKTREAHYGMFNSYLSVARRALASNNFVFSVRYIESALQYRDENKIYIHDDSDAKVLLKAVVDGYYYLGDQALLKYDFSQAVKNFQAAQGVCEAFLLTHCRVEAVEKALRAEREYGSKNTSRSVVATLPSPAISVAPDVLNVPDLSPLQANAYVRELLSDGHLKAWAGDISGARHIVSQILPLVVKYELREDVFINHRMASLNTMIKEKDCEFRQRDLQTLLNGANEFFRRGYYIDAQNSLVMAGELQGGARECIWSFSDSIASLDYIAVAAGYQVMIHEAHRQYFNCINNNFSPFFLKFRQAEEFYVRNRLADVGVKRSGLFDFAASSANTSFMIAVAGELTEKGDYLEVLQLFKILKRNGYDQRQLKSLMDKAGGVAAKGVFAKNPNVKPSAYINTLTDDDPWFRNYSRSFIKNWPK